MHKCQKAFSHYTCNDVVLIKAPKMKRNIMAGWNNRNDIIARMQQSLDYDVMHKEIEAHTCRHADRHKQTDISRRTYVYAHTYPRTHTNARTNTPYAQTHKMLHHGQPYVPNFHDLFLQFVAVIGVIRLNFAFLNISTSKPTPSQVIVI